MARLPHPPLRVWVWTAATLTVVVIAALLWRGSDAAATHSSTAPAADLLTGRPAAELSPAWSADSARTPRRVVQSGRVVLGSTRGVTALDPGTGTAAWQYTRGNARLCDLTAVDGIVVAVFATTGRCNEAVALDAGTGVRVWTRSVSYRRDVELASTDRIVLASSPTGVVTLDPTGHGTRWRYQPPVGCRLLGADVGSTGVALLQRCAGSPAVQLRLLDGFDGDPRWSRDLAVPTGTSPRLVGTDGLVDVVVGDELQILGADDGTLLQTLPLPAEIAPAPAGSTETLQQAGIGDSALVWVRGTVYALDASTGAVRWQRPALGLPAVGSPDKSAAGARTAATVVVPEDGAFVSRDLATGAEAGRSGVPTLPDGGRAWVIGPVVVYRTVDRVLGFR